MGLAYVVSGGQAAWFCRRYAMWLNCTTQPAPTLLRAMPKPAPTPCGACASCVSFAAENHPDTFYITGKSSIGVTDVRDCLYHASLARFGHNYKVFICEQAQNLTHAAQNALLKSMEEPEPAVVFLLASPSTSALLPTVISRCITWQVSDETKKAPSESVTKILGRKKYDSISANDIWQNHEGLSRPELLIFLQDLYDYAAQTIVQRALCGEPVTASSFSTTDAIKRAISEIEHNANPKLAFLLMLLNF